MAILSDTARRGFSWRAVALALIVIWFTLGGIAHFVWTGVFAGVTPEWIPFRRAVVLITGALELAGAAGVLIPRLRRVAGLALAAFVICVTPVHVDMLIHADRHPGIGEAALIARLLFQPIYAWIIWAATQRRES